jgi:hypothetical protein
MNIVKEIQQKLKSKGYDPGPVDGDLGPKTLGAMKSYLSTNLTPVVEKAKTVAAPVVEKAVVAVKTTINPAPPIPQIDANLLKGRDRPLYVKKVLEDLGWKDYQAAAMVGNFMQESYSDLRTNVWGDNKTALGIAQWRDNYDRKTGAHSPGRLTDLTNFAAKLNKSMTDLDTQAQFVHWELTKGSEKALGKKLKATKDIDEALLIAIGYERPAGYKPDNPRAGHGWANREKFAKSLL